MAKTHFVNLAFEGLRIKKASVTKTSSQKHLGIILDTQLKIDEHLKVASGKINYGTST